MLRTELLEIIANGENSGVEFKRDDIRPEQLAKEVVALANLRGGLILLGVEDDGSISGINRENLEEWVMTSVFSAKVHPMILPFYEEIQIEDGKRVAVISLTQGTSKPYVVRHNQREDVYVRLGSTSRLASREEQARLYESGGILHTEVLPVAGTSFASLSRERLTDYLQNILQEPEMPTTEQEWITRLLGLGYLVEGVGDQVVCTIAGLLLFGTAPRRYLRQSGIRLMVFDGDSMEYRAELDEVINAPFVGLWTTEGGTRQLEEVNYGIIERFIDKITPFISEEADNIDSGFRRESQWHYPKEAIREALINALVHRDWTRMVDIEVVVYSNRIEISSPGAMQNSMTIEKMLAGQRSPRNPLIVEVMRDYGYVDARGMGVRTKIIPLMRQHSTSEPEFQLTDDYLKLTLYR
ncbi:putative DNA binding domain-containing protein [Vibrio harveyi]|uniref:RNA-binding domain-containing protein n=1 Tax=Vibrio TaxID=662 RepID=UPI000154173E|nr:MULTISPECIES: RNA-binding domain-containing protein [Vibrio]EDL53526.1 hypothetical protein VSAK1_23939 [Vibrio mediterranei AK1]ELI6429397.1 putative DNA binding domain-containing protein [Vibrio harveyi]